MSIGDETAERLAPHPTTWAAPADTTSAALGEPRPRSLTPAGRLSPPVTALPGWKAAGALPPVPAAFPSTPAESGGNAAVDPAGHHVADRPVEAPAGRSLMPSQAVGVHPVKRHGAGLSVTPPPHDPDRVITDWWWDDEPDPRVPGWHVVGWLVLAAALWALLILVGYDVWHLLGLRMPWAA